MKALRIEEWKLRDSPSLAALPEKKEEAEVWKKDAGAERRDEGARNEGEMREG